MKILSLISLLAFCCACNLLTSKEDVEYYYVEPNSFTIFPDTIPIGVTFLDAKFDASAPSGHHSMVGGRKRRISSEKDQIEIQMRYDKSGVATTAVIYDVGTVPIKVSGVKEKEIEYLHRNPTIKRQALVSGAKPDHFILKFIDTVESILYDQWEDSMAVVLHDSKYLHQSQFSDTLHFSSFRNVELRYSSKNFDKNELYYSFFRFIYSDRHGYQMIHLGLIRGLKIKIGIPEVIVVHSELH